MRVVLKKELELFLIFKPLIEIVLFTSFKEQTLRYYAKISYSRLYKPTRRQDNCVITVVRLASTANDKHGLCSGAHLHLMLYV